MQNKLEQFITSFAVESEDGSIKYSVMGKDAMWAIFSNDLMPLWVEQEPTEPKTRKFALVTKNHDPLIYLCQTEHGIVVRPTDKSIKVKSSKRVDDTYKGLMTEWIPNLMFVNCPSTATSERVATNYQSMREAFNAVTNAMAVQYCGVLAQLSNINTTLDVDGSLLSKPMNDGLDQDSIAMNNINIEIADAITEQILGRFLRVWQEMESLIRRLMIQAGNDGSGLSNIYKPASKGELNFSKRVTNLLQSIDPEMCKEIMDLAKIRNNIVHGNIIGYGRPKEGNHTPFTAVRMEPHIVHQDVNATLFISAPNPSEENVFMCPADKSHGYNMDYIEAVTNKTMHMTSKVNKIVENPNITFTQQTNVKKKSVRSGRRRNRRRGKRKN